MTPLDRALDQAFTSDAWNEMIAKAEQAERLPSSLDPEVYYAAFSDGAGRMVLDDMFERFVNVSRVIPGEGSDAAFYREGMAQVVFHIMHMMARAVKGDDIEQG
jgi:hypothetical protein